MTVILNILEQAPDSVIDPYSCIVIHWIEENPNMNQREIARRLTINPMKVNYLENDIDELCSEPDEIKQLQLKV
jgi:hypothetical protein